MKYFTAELFERLQDFDAAAMDAADESWRKARTAYRRSYARARKRLPVGLRALLEGHVLHDAVVLGMGGRGKEFVIALRLAPPPRELLIVRYRLLRSPTITRDAFTSKASGAPQWLYDEVDVKGQAVRHSILFSNGWEIELEVGDVAISSSEVVYPFPDMEVIPVNGVARTRARPA